MKILLALCLVICSAVYSWACCTPPQWEGVMGSQGGYAKGWFKRGVYGGYTAVSYDFTNKRSAVFTKISSKDYKGKWYVVSIYDKDADEGCKGNGKMYVVDLKKNKCYTKRLRCGMKESCIPSEAKDLGTYFLGLKGGYLLHAYQIEKHGKMDCSLPISVSVQDTETKGVCIPVGETFQCRRLGVDFMEVIGFSNVTHGIKNATVFDVPKQCDKELDIELAEMIPNRDHYILGF